MEDIIIS